MKVLVGYKTNLLRSSLKARGLFGTINRAWNKWLYSVRYLPTYIQIEITNRCNLSCPYCAASRDIMRDNYYDMEFKDFKKIIDDISSVNNYYPTLQLACRGEPFLNKDIFVIIDYAAKKSLYIIVNTNGLLLNSENNNRLLRSDLNHIVISLDSIKKDIYKEIRVGGDLGVLMKNIKDLTDKKRKLGLKKPFIEIQFIITKKTEDEIEEVKKISKKLNADNLKFKTYKLPCRGKSKESIAYLQNFIPENQMFSRYKKENGNLVQKINLKTCSWADDCLIYADGDIGPCCEDYNKEYVVGNVIRQNFWTVWNCKIYKELRKKIKKRSLSFCISCS